MTANSKRAAQKLAATTMAANCRKSSYAGGLSEVKK
jgi:hypothetical protein